MPAENIVKQIYRPVAMVGQVYAKPWNSAAGLAPIGNVLELVTEYKEDVETQDDMTVAGGAIHAERRRVTGATVKAKLADISIVNLARAVYGVIDEKDAAAITDREYTAYLGALLPLPYIGMTGVTLKTGADVATATAVTAAGNFEVRPEGIWFLPTASGLTNGAKIWVSGSYVDQVVVEHLVTKAPELQMRYAGINEVMQGGAAVVDLWRVSQGVTKQLALIQPKGFMNLEVEGSLLQDPNITGAGVSKFMRTTWL